MLPSMRRAAVPPAGPGTGHPGRSVVLLFVAVVLVAANLRSPVSSFGAVLTEVRTGAGLSAGAAGAVTSMPLVCFAVVGSASPWLARRLGLGAAIGWSVALLTGGLLLRVVGGVPLLFAGTLLACAGIAVVNVLLPVVVKHRFPERIGLVTGSYTAALAGGSALAAGFSAPLAELGGWRTALGAWAVFSLAAVVVWVVATRGSGRRADERKTPPEDDGDAPARRTPIGAITRHRVSWALAVFFGTQAIYAYVQMGWLPAIYRDAGFSGSTAGAMLAVSILVGVPISFAVPSLAARHRSQRTWAVGLTLVTAVAFVGLVVAPVQGAWLWAVMLGIGTGAFPLALAMFSLRTATSSDTAAMSAFGQGVGYLLAAVGPIAFGVLREASGAWTVPLLALLGVLAVQVFAGLVAGRDVVVSGSARP